MSGGRFMVGRSIWTHPAFKDEPFTEREAFLWMVGKASWKPRSVRVGNYVAETERGQLAASVRFMADVWKWPKSRVGRYLERLKNRDTVKTENGTGVLVITICSYDDFQIVDEESGTVAGQQSGQNRDSSGTVAGQTRKQNKKIKKDKDIDPCKILQEILPEDLAKDFARHRREAAKPKLTERAARGVVNSLKEIQSAGFCPSQAIELAIERGWKTAKLDWLRNSQPKPNGGPRGGHHQQAGRLERALQYIADSTDAGPGNAGGENWAFSQPVLAGPGERCGVSGEAETVVRLPLGSSAGGVGRSDTGLCENGREGEAKTRRDSGQGFSQVGAVAARNVFGTSTV